MTALPTPAVGDVWGTQLNTAIEERAVPVGGTTGQVLTKASATDRDVEWASAGGGGGGFGGVTYVWGTSGSGVTPSWTPDAAVNEGDLALLIVATSYVSDTLTPDSSWRQLWNDAGYNTGTYGSKMLCAGKVLGATDLDTETVTVTTATAVAWTVTYLRGVAVDMGLTFTAARKNTPLPLRGAITGSLFTATVGTSLSSGITMDYTGSEVQGELTAIGTKDGGYSRITSGFFPGGRGWTTVSTSTSDFDHATIDLPLLGAPS